jgi:hypothetical protein
MAMTLIGQRGQAVPWKYLDDRRREGRTMLKGHAMKKIIRRLIPRSQTRVPPAAAAEARHVATGGAEDARPEFPGLHRRRSRQPARPETENMAPRLELSPYRVSVDLEAFSAWTLPAGDEHTSQARADQRKEAAITAESQPSRIDFREKAGKSMAPGDKPNLFNKKEAPKVDVSTEEVERLADELEQLRRADAIQEEPLVDTTVSVDEFKARRRAMEAKFETTGTFDHRGNTPKERLKNLKAGRLEGALNGMKGIQDEAVRERLKTVLLDSSNNYQALKSWILEPHNPLRSYTSGSKFGVLLRKTPLIDTPSSRLERAITELQAWCQEDLPRIQPLGDAGHAGAHFEIPWSDTTVDELLASMDRGIALTEAVDRAIDTEISGGLSRLFHKSTASLRKMGSLVPRPSMPNFASSSAVPPPLPGNVGSLVAGTVLSASPQLEPTGFAHGEDDVLAMDLASGSRQDPVAEAGRGKGAADAVTTQDISGVIGPMVNHKPPLDPGNTPEVQRLNFGRRALGQVDLVVNMMGRPDIQAKVRKALAANQFDPDRTAGKAIRSFVTGMQLVDLLVERPLSHEPSPAMADGLQELKDWWAAHAADLRPLGDGPVDASGNRPDPARVDHLMGLFGEGVALMRTLEAELTRQGIQLPPPTPKPSRSGKLLNPVRNLLSRTSPMFQRTRTTTAANPEPASGSRRIGAPMPVVTTSVADPGTALTRPDEDS